MRPEFKMIVYAIFVASLSFQIVKTKKENNKLKGGPIIFVREDSEGYPVISETGREI